MTVNTDFAEPFDPSNPDDVLAANTKIEWEQAWFHDPIFFGKYPDSMIN
jgi:beta-glucosidase